MSRRGWGLVVLFFIGWTLVYANRTVLAPLLVLLEAEWGLSRRELGLFNSLLFLVYWLVQVPAGWLSDRLGPKRVLVPTFLLQGLGATAGGLAWSPGSLLGWRMLVGLGQGPYYAAQYALATQEVGTDRRGMAVALINSGMAAGVGLGFLVATAVAFVWGRGWRPALWVLGLATVALAGVMAALVPGDRRRKPVSPARPGRRPLARRELARLYLVGFLGMYGLYTVLTWLPYYLQVACSVPDTRAGALALLVPAAAAPAGVLAGCLSDRLGARLPVLRALFVPAGLALALVVMVPFPLGVVLGATLYGLTGKLAADPLMVSYVADVTPPDQYASAFAALNFAGTAAMVVAPAMTGYLADSTGGFGAAFYLAALFQLAAWVLLGPLKEAAPSN